MKKYLYIIPLTLLISLFYFDPHKVLAATVQYILDHYNTVILLDNSPTSQYLIYSNNNDVNTPFYMDNGYLTWDYPTAFSKGNFNIGNFGPGEYDLLSIPGASEQSGWSTSNFYCFGKDPQGIQGYYNFSEPEPPEPEPGSTWLDDMWEWFLWVLGINDDYSGDIDAYITGGDRERIEYVTPSPTSIPPTPTPYNLNVIDPGTGQPVYTITGIPGSTTIINGGDTYNGSDFDIFSVDLQIGDSGTSNPKDGLNSVMESSNEYLKEIDISPVQNSFSIIPSDWFLMIGVLAALPFIAGFIMRLLK